MVTPNRTGEFYGRIQGWPKKEAIPGAIINSYNGFFQSAVTILMGCTALFFAPGSWLSTVEKYFAAALVFIEVNAISFSVGAVLVFSTFVVLHKPIKHFLRSKMNYLPKDLTLSEKGQLLSLSILRYAVFSSQFVLILWFLGLEFSIFNLYLGVAIGYFLLFTLPSVALAELGIRELSFALVFGAMGADISLVFLASLVLWLINLCLPALFGVALYLYGNRTTSSVKLGPLADSANAGH